jgi:hypothetical protein
MVKQMDFKRHYLLLLVLLLVPAVGVEAAKLYKWTDEQGNVHYTQIPPTERPAEVITTEPTQPVQPSDEEKANGSKQEDGVTATQAANIRIKQENCEASRRNLTIYQTSAQIRQADGTELTLSDEMREAKIRETRQQIEFYCN